MEDLYNYKEEEQDGLTVGEPLSWGGQWTEEKFDVFEKYVNAIIYFS